MIHCYHCIFWFKISSAPLLGECRRYAPKKITEKGVFFIKTPGECCCGDGIKDENNISENINENSNK